MKSKAREYLEKNKVTISYELIDRVNVIVSYYKALHALDLAEQENPYFLMWQELCLSANKDELCARTDCKILELERKYLKTE